MANISEQAATLVDNFDFLENWEEKYQYIIDLGKALPAMDVEDKTEANRVHGCMSQVWQHIRLLPDGVDLSADSDAIIVRGLIALIRDLVQNQPPAEIIAFDFMGFFSDLGLDRQLSPNRRNGMVAFVERMQTILK